VEASSKPDVLKALHQVASALRAKLGESLPSVQKFDVPIEATTSSLEALKNYSMGDTILREKGEAPSIPFLKRAIELDPNFPMAYAGLALRYLNRGEPSLALVYATKAYGLRDRVSEREKLRIAATYFLATGELEKYTQTYELWTADYPRDFVPHNALGTIYISIGKFEKALAEYQESLRLEPDNVNGYANLGFTYFGLNRLDEAKATFDQALAHKLDGGRLRVSMYLLAFLRGDSAQMEREVAWGAGKPGDEGWLLSAQSDTEAYYGRLSAEFQKLLDHRGIVRNFVTGALARLQIARDYAMAGDSAKAKSAYQDFLMLWKDADPDIPILKQAQAEYAKLQ